VIVVLVPATLLMDRIPADVKMSAVFAILVATSFMGFADILWHGTIPEPPMPAERPRASIRQVLVPLRDRRFRPWLVFAASWNFSMQLGGALCLVYFLENLRLKDNMLGAAIAVNVVGLLGSILTARRLGRLVDRWGPRRVLMVGHLFWSLFPAIWLLAVPRNAVIWVGLASTIGGIFPLAANNAALKLVSRFPKPDQSAMYMAASNSVANIAGGLGALAAGIFLQAMGDWSVGVGRFTLSAFPVLFIASFVLRSASAIVLVPRVREQGERDEERPLLLPLFFGLPIRRRRG
jgi:predicted MFS family arabinose efflux permease